MTWLEGFLHLFGVSSHQMKQSITGSEYPTCSACGITKKGAFGKWIRPSGLRFVFKWTSTFQIFSEGILNTCNQVFQAHIFKRVTHDNSETIKPSQAKPPAAHWTLNPLGFLQTFWQGEREQLHLKSTSWSLNPDSFDNSLHHCGQEKDLTISALREFPSSRASEKRMFSALQHVFLHCWDNN